MHKIVVDRVHNVIEVRVLGDATFDSIGLAGAAARKAVQSLNVKPGIHSSLYDLSDMISATPDAIARAASEWADPGFSCVRAKRIALVMPDVAMRQRLQPLTQARADLQTFAGRPHAMRWLFS